MKLKELKQKLSEYIYMEDSDVVDVVLAAALSNVLKVGNPVWLVVVGPPSSGKTQYIMPLEHSQPAGEKVIHQVTDLTPNTLLSGAKTKEYDPSLLTRLGENPGMLLFPDLTSLFNKDPQILNEVLGQLRHVYDGYLVKHTGNGLPMEWRGSLGIIAASTASIYEHFERIADMGERFLYYRMKPYDRNKALETAMGRKLYGKQLDEAIGDLYAEYIRGVMEDFQEKPRPTKEDNHALQEMAKIASIIRTPVHMDQYTGRVDRIPEPEMPMRTSLQLRTLAMGMMVMNVHEYGQSDLTEANLRALEWCAFSLANDERRATLKTLAMYAQGATAAAIGHDMHLPTKTAERYLDQLFALSVVRRIEVGSTHQWVLTDESLSTAILRATGAKQVDEAYDVENEYKEEETF